MKSQGMPSNTGSCGHMELSSPTPCRETEPQITIKLDHNQIWTQLPHMDFTKQANSARTPPPDFSQRIDTVYFKRHTDDWKVRIKKRILGEMKENPTGQALAHLIQQEQEILAKEVRCLQDRAWKARRRAGERKEQRNNTQNNLRQRISLLKAALAEAAPSQSKDKMKGATRKAMQGLGFIHLRDTLQKLVGQHIKWTSILTEKLQSHSSRLTQEVVETRLEALAEMTLLMQATQTHSQDLQTRSLIYDVGPWKGENLLVGIETFFQKNAYHPYAPAAILNVGKWALYRCPALPRAPY